MFVCVLFSFSCSHSCPLHCQCTGASWTELTTPGTTLHGESFSCAASSAGGARLIAATFQGFVWGSVDAGQTWMKIRDTYDGYSGVACDSTGSIILASTYNFGEGGLYRLTPSPTPSPTPAPTEAQGFIGGWQTLSAPYNSYGGAASSANGSIYAVSIYYGGLLYSSDAGETFGGLAGATTQSYRAIAMDAKATTFWAVAYGLIYKGNADRTWTELVNDNSTLMLDWRGIGVSADGVQVVAGALGGGLWRSVDGGLSWTKITDDTMSSIGWTGAAPSADGSRILASAESPGQGLYLSDDFGT